MITPYAQQKRELVRRFRKVRPFTPPLGFKPSSEDFGVEISTVDGFQVLCYTLLHS